MLEKLTLVHVSPNTCRKETEMLGQLVAADEQTTLAAAWAADAPQLPAVTEPIVGDCYVSMDGVMVHIDGQGWKNQWLGAIYTAKAAPSSKRPETLEVRTQQPSFYADFGDLQTFGRPTPSTTSHLRPQGGLADNSCLHPRGGRSTPDQRAHRYPWGRTAHKDPIVSKSPVAQRQVRERNEKHHASGPTTTQRALTATHRPAPCAGFFCAADLPAGCRDPQPPAGECAAGRLQPVHLVSLQRPDHPPIYPTCCQLRPCAADSSRFACPQQRFCRAACFQQHRNLAAACAAGGYQPTTAPPWPQPVEAWRDRRLPVADGTTGGLPTLRPGRIGDVGPEGTAGGSGRRPLMSCRASVVSRIRTPTVREGRRHLRRPFGNYTLPELFASPPCTAPGVMRDPLQQLPNSISTEESQHFPCLVSVFSISTDKALNLQAHNLGPSVYLPNKRRIMVRD